MPNFKDALPTGPHFWLFSHAAYYSLDTFTINRFVGLYGPPDMEWSLEAPTDRPTIYPSSPVCWGKYLAEARA